RKDGSRDPEDTLRKDFIDIHPTASSFKVMLDKVKHHAKKSMNDAFEYAKQKWDKSQKVPDSKVGDLVLVSTLNFNNTKGPNKLKDSYVEPFVIAALHGTNAVQVRLSLVSTLNFNNIKGPKKLKNSYLGPFVIVSLHGINAVQVELSGEFENKHPTFPVSLIKPYQPTDKELFPLRNPTPLTVPPVEQDEDKKIKKVIKERRLRATNQREYLVRYRNPVHEDEWLAESEIPDSDKLLRRFRHERRPQA
ncbi:hypothetical protein O181_130455, partial [Austropuccinia psidii MF-1]|nr:hypothetical protein [Austropuccinia psidii MF-1]